MYVHTHILTLQVVLCFSPVGSTLRVRARKFPAIVNCTSIDWFHEWPEEALNSVSYRFLTEGESELLTVRENQKTICSDVVLYNVHLIRGREGGKFFWYVYHVPCCWGTRN